MEAGELEQSGPINSLWWRWTAPSDGLLTLDPSQSPIEPFVSVFSGSGLTALTVLAQTHPENLHAPLLIPVQAGTTYSIAVDGYDNLLGTVQLDYTFEAAPTNDQRINAIELIGTTGRVQGQNRTAWAEANEPEQSGSIHSVWWKWTASRHGLLSLDTLGSDFDTYLSVFSSSGPNSLTMLAQNDDISHLNRQSWVQVSVQAATTYWIAVDGYDESTGQITLNYQFVADNLAPTDLRLSVTQILENQPIGTLVGDFTTIDPDADNTFHYQLVSGVGDTDNARFTIVGHQLYTHAVLDYEVQPRYTIRVQTRDNHGGTYEKVLTIAITDDVRDNFTSLIHAALATDTAATGINSDGITSDPTIAGWISEPQQLVALRAGLNGMPTTAYASILAAVEPDGRFRLSRAHLETIAGTRLTDGAHVVHLLATDGYGNTKTAAVPFRLDTTVPIFEVQGLIDGIRWAAVERLQGQLKSIEPGVRVVYQFNHQGESDLAIAADGTFNQLLAVPTQAGTHTLTVTSIDLAGNRHSVAFQFFVSAPRVAVDDDLLTSFSGGGDSSGGSEAGGSGGSGSSTSGSDYRGGRASDWWIYLGGSGSNSGGPGSPPPPPPPHR